MIKRILKLELLVTPNFFRMVKRNSLLASKVMLYDIIYPHTIILSSEKCVSCQKLYYPLSLANGKV